MKKLLLLSLLCLILVVPSSAWVSGYNYRTGHYINGSDSGAQTNYQILLNVSNTAGTSSGNLLYTQGHCLNFPNDLRFTDISDNLWDYWIESNNTTYASVWIEVPSIPSGSTNQVEIYCYYGNSTATSASNGTNTFPLLFDHFDGMSLNTSKFGTTGGISISGSICTLYSASAISRLFSKNLYGVNISLRENISYPLSPTGAILIGFYDSVNTWALFFPTAADDRFQSRKSTGETTYLNTTYINKYNTREIIRNSTASTSAFVNNTLIAEHFTQVPDSQQYVFFSSDVGTIVLLDWVFLRNYVYPEPIHSTYVSEESAPCIADFSGIPLSGEVPLSVQFTDLSTSGVYPLYYIWDFGDSSPLSSLQNPAHTYTTTGTYDVKLKVSNGINEDWENKTAYVVAGNATTPTPTPTPSPTFTYLTPTPTPTPAPREEFFQGNISLSFEDPAIPGPMRVIFYNDTGFYVGIFSTDETVMNLTPGSYQVSLQPSKTDYLVNPKSGLDAVADFVKGNLVAIVLLCLVIGILIVRRKK